jgi:hypothetical protein
MQPKLSRFVEAMELLNSVEDLTTSQLMNRANFVVLRRFNEEGQLPVADFDLRYFMEIIHEFCSDHESLRRILQGEDLRAMIFDEE